MKILIIGSGGREHALAWKCAQSEEVDEVLVAPGNGGTGVESKCRNVDVTANDIGGLLTLAQNEGVALTIVGPEAPLVAGIVDRFDEAGLACFGPSAAAARLEGSKAWAKDFFRRHQIPTAGYETFTDLTQAEKYIRASDKALVIKADGLAAGKGVIVAQDQNQTLDAARDMLGAGAFGAAGAKIVIEDYLHGEEASFMAMVDGQTVLPLATSQDHKAAFNGDEGPNTGGMGAYSPAPVITAPLHDRIMQQVMLPAASGLQADGARFRGFLYAGLMIGDDGSLGVLEFNVRLGDPETQPILMRLESDLVQHCLAACEGRLADESIHWSEQSALGVVMAAEGYPGDYPKGMVIANLDKVPDGVKVFHAGTTKRDNRMVTAGGRVICVTAVAKDLAAAQALAYQGVDVVSFDPSHFRTDIGAKSLSRSSN